MKGSSPAQMYSGFYKVSRLDKFRVIIFTTGTKLCQLILNDITVDLKDAEKSIFRYLLF